MRYLPAGASGNHARLRASTFVHGGATKSARVDCERRFGYTHAE